MQPLKQDVTVKDVLLTYCAGASVGRTGYAGSYAAARNLGRMCTCLFVVRATFTLYLTLNCFITYTGR